MRHEVHDRIEHYGVLAECSKHEDGITIVVLQPQQIFNLRKGHGSASGETRWSI